MSNNFKQLWKKTKKRILTESKKTNPWAVCHASVKGEEEGGEAAKKFERCVKDVKNESDEKPSSGLSKKKKSLIVKKAKSGKDIGKKGKGFEKVKKKAAASGAKDPEAVAAAAMWKNIKREGDEHIDEQITTIDKPQLLKKPTESEEDRKKREAEEKHRAMVSGIVEQDDEVETTAPEHPIADPTGINSLEAEDIPIAETYKNKLASLENKKAKLHEQLKALEEEMQKTRVIGEKKAAYESARESVAKLKEELDAFKNGDIPMDEDKIPGGLADDMTNADIAKKHGVDKKVIDKQVEIGKGIEAEHTPDEEEQEEIAQDHEVENPKYYKNDDGPDLQDMEKAAEKEKDEKLDEGKKKPDKDLMKQAKYNKKKEDIKKHGASEDPHKPTQTIEDKKSKGKKAKGKHGTREAGKKAAREAMLKENNMSNRYAGFLDDGGLHALDDAITHATEAIEYIERILNSSFTDPSEVNEYKKEAGSNLRQANELFAEFLQQNPLVKKTPPRETPIEENRQKYFKEAWKKVSNKTDTDGFISIG